MYNSILSRKSFAVLLLIATVAVSLSAASYQHSIHTSQEIFKISSHDIIANTRNEAYDLSRIIINKMDSVTTNLQVLSHSPSVQRGISQDSITLFDSAQYSTDDITEFYMHLDAAGKIVMASNIPRATNQYDSINSAGSPPTFLVEPNKTGDIHYSGFLDSPDNQKRLYVSYPIIYSLQDDPSQEGQFKGVIVGVIRLDTLGKLLQQELSAVYDSDLILADANTGVVVYSSEQSAIGKSVTGSVSSYLGTSDTTLPEPLQAKPGYTSATASDGKAFTIAYQPIIHNGNHFWTLYVLTPHILADDVVMVLKEQERFEILILLIIGAVSVGLAYLVISWNKRLESLVSKKTDELRIANRSLEENNEQLRRANEKLLVHDRLQKEFINIAAHELRTPMAPIVGMVDILDSQFRKAESDEIRISRDNFNIISRNALRLEKLATDILDVTKIESQQSLHLNKEQFDLFEAVQIATEDAKRLYTWGSAVRCIIDAPASLGQHLPIFADKSRLMQVLANLLANAFKFTDWGEISVAIRQDRDRTIIVSVADTGTGVDPDMMPRLFTKFGTKSGTDRVQAGVGLGLYISKSIVEAHGGMIWAENNKDRGATFSFTLPQSEKSNSRAAPSASGGKSNPAGNRVEPANPTAS